MIYEVDGSLKKGPRLLASSRHKVEASTPEEAAIKGLEKCYTWLQPLEGVWRLKVVDDEVGERTIVHVRASYEMKFQLT